MSSVTGRSVPGRWTMAGLHRLRVRGDEEDHHRQSLRLLGDCSRPHAAAVTTSTVHQPITFYLLNISAVSHTCTSVA